MGYPRAFRSIAGYRTLLSPPQQVASRLGRSESDGFIHPANHHLRSHPRDGGSIILASPAPQAALSSGRKAQAGQIAGPHPPPLRRLPHDLLPGHDDCWHRHLYRSRAYHHPHHRPALLTVGCTQGDPLGVPGYFTPLLFLVFTLTSLLIIYALTWLGIALAYQYASYKVQDEEKKN